MEGIKNDPTEEQNIDSNEIFLFKNVLNLIKTPQNTNFVKMLSIRNKSRDKCLNFVSDSIGCIQMKIFHLGLTSILKRSSD